MAKARKKTPATRKTNVLTGWTKLTWDDLERWTDSRSVQRGRAYQRQNRVSDMGITADGRLLATVTGTQRYVVTVQLKQSGKKAAKLESQCTCPVGDRCKHAVAVVVDLLEMLADEQTIPTVAATDQRWDILAYEDVDAEDVLDDLLDDAEYAAVSSKARDKVAPVNRTLTQTQWNEKIREHINQKSQQELAAFMMTLVERFTELREEFVERILLEQGSGAQLLKEARKEMRRVTEEIGWQNHWDDGGHTPDYSKLKHKLQRLIEMGHADAVAALGRQLLDRGMQQVRQSHDEGETVVALSDCLSVVFDALLHASMPVADKLLYVIDACLMDDYELIGDAMNPVLALGGAQDWTMVAQHLRARLDELPTDIKRSDYASTYHRDCVSGWLLHALKNSGQEDALQRVYEAEARATCSYQRLVRYLLEKGDDEAVCRWSMEGIEQTREKWPGIASSLADSLCELARRKKQWDVVAAHAAYAFFYRPDRHTFDKMIADARKAKCDQPVRSLAMSFLETGHAPITVTLDRNDRLTTRIDPAWPLPVPDYLRMLWPKASKHPHWDVLLNMAIADKRHDDVLHWYDRMMDKSAASHHLWPESNWNESVANAVAQSHPQRALAIRQQQLAAILPQAGHHAYESAAACLRKIQPLLTALNRQDQWKTLLADIRQQYKNRPRFMEILDRFDGQTILHGRKKRTG